MNGSGWLAAIGGSPTIYLVGLAVIIVLLLGVIARMARTLASAAAQAISGMVRSGGSLLLVILILGALIALATR